MTTGHSVEASELLTTQSIALSSYALTCALLNMVDSSLFVTTASTETLNDTNFSGQDIKQTHNRLQALWSVQVHLTLFEVLKGSATKGQFRKCGLTVVFQITTPDKQGKGVQQGSGTQKSYFSSWPFTVDP